MRCDLRDLHECSCGPNECRAAPPKQINLAETPALRFTARDQMIFMLIASAFIPVAIFIGAAMADPVIHQQILAEQESSHHG